MPACDGGSDVPAAWALLGIYVIFAVVQGRVHAKRRAWGECIERAIESHRFWTVIAIYAALAVALATLF